MMTDVIPKPMRHVVLYSESQMVVDVSYLIVYASGEKRLEGLATVLNDIERLQESQSMTSASKMCDSRVAEKGRIEDRGYLRRQRLSRTAFKAYRMIASTDCRCRTENAFPRIFPARQEPNAFRTQTKHNVSPRVPL